MHIKIESEEELKEIAATLLHLAFNTRYWQKEWHEHHGGKLLHAKKRWEQSLDKYLEKLGAEKTSKIHEVHISIKNSNSNEENVQP